MKLLRKLNRGAILTFVIVLGVVIYLIVLSAGRQAEIPRIKVAAEQYVQAEIAWQMLPEKYRVEKASMPDAEYQAYIADLSVKIRSLYIDNEPIVQSLIRRLKVDLVQQAKGQGVVFAFQKTISKYERFEFDGDLVTVTMTTQTIYDGPSGTGGGTARMKTVGETTDTLILQKVADQWKIVFANLVRPYDNRPGTFGMGKY
jgi:hypothetical protein